MFRLQITVRFQHSPGFQLVLTFEGHRQRCERLQQTGFRARLAFFFQVFVQDGDAPLAAQNAMATEFTMLSWLVPLP